MGWDLRMILVLRTFPGTPPPHSMWSLHILVQPRGVLSINAARLNLQGGRPHNEG